MPSGTHTSIQFNTSVLGGISTPQQLLAAFKEIVQTRYSEKTLQDVHFVFHIRGLNEVYVTLDSRERGHELHSFRWHVEKGVRDGYVKCIYNDIDRTSAGAPWKLSRYYIIPKGSSSFDLKREFPRYGLKNQQTQRIFISLQGRMIEPAKFHEFMNKKAAHNDDNGYLTFVDFVSTDIAKKPEPSTTKVSMYSENPIYKEFVKDLQSILTNADASDEDAGSVESTSLEPSSSMEAIPVQPTQAPLSNPNRNCVANIEAILGVKFKLIAGVLSIKENEDSTVWRPLSEYMIVRRP
jgi:hypothetical protein